MFHTKTFSLHDPIEGEPSKADEGGEVDQPRIDNASTACAEGRELEKSYESVMTWSSERGWVKKAL